MLQFRAYLVCEGALNPGFLSKLSSCFVTGSVQ